MADFSISSLSRLDLLSECTKLNVPANLIKSGDETKIGEYLSDHNLLAQVQKDLGQGKSATSAAKPPAPDAYQGQQYNSLG